MYATLDMKFLDAWAECDGNRCTVAGESSYHTSELQTAENMP